MKDKEFDTVMRNCTLCTTAVLSRFHKLTIFRFRKLINPLATKSQMAKMAPKLGSAKITRSQRRHLKKEHIQNQHSAIGYTYQYEE